MCGHDWCSMRISKELDVLDSGKDDGFQPAAPALKSPGVSEAGQSLLEQRGRKAACHSDIVPDEDNARATQQRLAAR